MKSFLKKVLSLPLFPFLRKISVIENAVEENRILLGKVLIGQRTGKEKFTRLADAEFKIFSQWGEDGIIQYLISCIPIQNEIFIEFGVEDYRESNTRFLLMHNNWKGLIIDGNPKYIDNIKRSSLYWRYDLTAISAFITRENINSLIASAGITNDIGVLSIDLDGNDYWIWEAIDVISPRIVICEYNSIFGNKAAVSVPYDEQFNRFKAHYSSLYFGASLPALCFLAERKGYCFVGSNSAGNNAFFVRRDVISNIPVVDCKLGYVKSKTRESRAENGSLTFISGDERIKLIGNQQVVDVKTMSKVFIRDIEL